MVSCIDSLGYSGQSAAPSNDRIDSRGPVRPRHDKAGRTTMIRPQQNSVTEPRGERLVKARRYSEFGGPELIREDEVAPPSAAPGDVVIRMAATSVNGADWK